MHPKEMQLRAKTKTERIGLQHIPKKSKIIYTLLRITERSADFLRQSIQIGIGRAGRIYDVQQCIDSRKGGLRHVLLVEIKEQFTPSVGKMVFCYLPNTIPLGNADELTILHAFEQAIQVLLGFRPNDDLVVALAGEEGTEILGRRIGVYPRARLPVFLDKKPVQETETPLRLGVRIVTIGKSRRFQKMRRRLRVSLHDRTFGNRGYLLRLIGMSHHERLRRARCPRIDIIGMENLYVDMLVGNKVARYVDIPLHKGNCVCVWCIDFVLAFRRLGRTDG